MRILRAENHRRMPWKNGGGVTTEIAVFPEGAGLDEFGWRISMAQVASDGPFSSFPGVDRTLAILEGEGIALDIEGRPPVTLTRSSQPLAFPADRPTSARLVAGPVVDFNVMTRRGRFEHCVERLAPGSIVERDAQNIAIFAAVGTATVSLQGARTVLAAHDAAVINGGCVVESDASTQAYLVALERVPQR
jgi:environmental stress-induced protein Ves